MEFARLLGVRMRFKRRGRRDGLNAENAEDAERKTRRLGGLSELGV
jgi:hypothetical protein